jgi:hypothetical protein
MMASYILHPLWLYLFVKKARLGMYGVGLGRTTTEFISAFVVISYLNIKGLFKELNLMISRQAFKNWGNYLRYSIPMGCTMYIDWLSSDL